jgi:hypothetical protein
MWSNKFPVSRTLCRFLSIPIPIAIPIPMIPVASEVWNQHLIVSASLSDIRGALSGRQSTAHPASLSRRDDSLRMASVGRGIGG